MRLSVQELGVPQALGPVDADSSRLHEPTMTKRDEVPTLGSQDGDSARKSQFCKNLGKEARLLGGAGSREVTVGAL